MSKFPILKPRRVADLTAMVRYLATCQEEQRKAEILDEKLHLSMNAKEIVADHPELFRVGGEKTISVSLLFRFLIPGRPILNEEQTNAILEETERRYHQAIEHSRHDLAWWQWITSFVAGGVAGSIILETVRYFLLRG